MPAAPTAPTAPPALGADRYVEKRMAEAGPRSLSGKDNKGFAFNSGPYKGMTGAQGVEAARSEYARMAPVDRQQYDAEANGDYGAAAPADGRSGFTGMAGAGKAGAAGQPGAFRTRTPEEVAARIAGSSVSQTSTPVPATLSKRTLEGPMSGGFSSAQSADYRARALAMGGSARTVSPGPVTSRMAPDYRSKMMAMGNSAQADKEEEMKKKQTVARPLAAR